MTKINPSLNDIISPISEDLKVLKLSMKEQLNQMLV